MRGYAESSPAVTRTIDNMPLIEKFWMFWATPWLEKVQRVGEFYWLLKTQYYYRSEEHTSELKHRLHPECRFFFKKKKKNTKDNNSDSDVTALPCRVSISGRAD